MGSIPGSGRCSGGGHGNPLQDSCLENLIDRGGLVGYSPSCHKELDTTELTLQAHVHTHTHTHKWQINL